MNEKENHLPNLSDKERAHAIGGLAHEGSKAPCRSQGTYEVW